MELDGRELQQWLILLILSCLSAKGGEKGGGLFSRVEHCGPRLYKVGVEGDGRECRNFTSLHSSPVTPGIYIRDRPEVSLNTRSSILPKKQRHLKTYRDLGMLKVANASIDVIDEQTGELAMHL